MSTWNCGNKTCPTHSEPTHYCAAGVWTCRRRQPPCTTHPRPKVACPGGTAWSCGALKCQGTHPSTLIPCPPGVGEWVCGRVNPPCPKHRDRSDHCAIRGSYLVAGLGQRKQALFSAGGNLLDLAIAVLETETMQVGGPKYPYGDGKTMDAANFGIFKQNWQMIRSSMPQFAGRSAADFNLGAALNHNLTLDIQTLHASQKLFGIGPFGKWFAGHRGGDSGLRNMWPKRDINNYKNAIHWIRDEINKDIRFRSDDTRFWVDVPPV